MKKIQILAKLLDSIISLSLLYVGIYLFFFKGQFVNGAILFGSQALWTIDRFLVYKFYEK